MKDRTDGQPVEGHDAWLVRYWSTQESAKTREKLRIGLIWGVCHVHTPVDQAEHEFDTYIRTGDLPQGTHLVEFKARAIASAEHYAANVDVNAFNAGDTYTKIHDVVANVWGLGPVKATFALTSAGFLDVACLDTHIIDMRLLPALGPEWHKARITGYWNSANKSVKTAVNRYLEMVHVAYGTVDGSGILQWADYAKTVDAFAVNGHAVFFNVIESV